MEPDFSGYATKAGLKCSDGRTILTDAFKENDGQTVPLVWQHGHSEPANVLGHARLENRPDGVYAYAYFNETDGAKSAKLLVQHKDITQLSIYANQLVERSKQVLHGSIREVSLVLSGANPGALIDFVSLAHSDGEVEVLEDEAIIYTGLPLEHESMTDDNAASHADSSGGSGSDVGDKTVQEVYDTLTDEQKKLVHFMLGEALAASGTADTAQHSDTDDGDADTTTGEGDDALVHQEGTDNMTRNVFDQDGQQTGGTARATLTHDQLRTIVDDAQRLGSFKESFLKHAVDYGIENIDLLFPDAKAITSAPELVSRRMEWVSEVVNGSKHSPFSRIKSLSADITLDTARAKGYVKGNLKKEEFFALTKRVTTPQTIYKKQKLDRDDIIDITDLDVVAWLKGEMRLMLEEELARAVLLGDGREPDDEDKINETNIRPIAYDDDFYAPKYELDANSSGQDLEDAILRARVDYRGTGNPTMFVVETLLTDLLLSKDKMGRRLYNSVTELASALRVSKIVTVDVMGPNPADGTEVLAVLVNMSDYTIGADRGGAVSMFDDFDIDYNQYKYLIETRVSGALTKFKSALVFNRASGTNVATVTAPTFNATTGVVTIPATTGVQYKMDGVNVSAGAQTAIASGDSTTIEAVPQTGYYFSHNTDTDWTFTRS